jgi:NADH pyrophosphatase NudC (nudix superfamily)
LETGRVDKGEKSQQTFGTDYGSYSAIWTYCSEYQLMPRSVKPVEVAEIRSYCPGCGTRMKKKTWKFCPNCGESLD